MKTILTRADYEDFLLYLYFGAGNDRLLNCIARAYLDFNRTLHGLRIVATKDELHKRATTELRQLFVDIQSGLTGIEGQGDFDRWHQGACEQLVALYQDHSHSLYAGQAQKWLNMTFKYIYTIGEQRLPGFAGIYQFCHVPLDNVLINKLASYGFPPLPCAWSRIKDYEEYLARQMWVRQRFKVAPLDVEFLLWLGKDIDERILA